MEMEDTLTSLGMELIEFNLVKNSDLTKNIDEECSLIDDSPQNTCLSNREKSAEILITNDIKNNSSIDITFSGTQKENVNRLDILAPSSVTTINSVDKDIHKELVNIKFTSQQLLKEEKNHLKISSASTREINAESAAQALIMLHNDSSLSSNDKICDSSLKLNQSTSAEKISSIIFQKENTSESTVIIDGSCEELLERSEAVSPMQNKLDASIAFKFSDNNSITNIPNMSFTNTKGLLFANKTSEDQNYSTIGSENVFSPILDSNHNCKKLPTDQQDVKKLFENSDLRYTRKRKRKRPKTLPNSVFETSNERTKMIIMKPKLKRQSFPPEDPLDLDELQKPILDGFVREVVYRQIATSTSCDIYYRPPQGPKLRSRNDVMKFLGRNKTNFTLKNFSYHRRPLGLGAGEVVRNANIHFRYIEAQKTQQQKDTNLKIKKIKNCNPSNEKVNFIEHPTESTINNSSKEISKIMSKIKIALRKDDNTYHIINQKGKLSTKKSVIHSKPCLSNSASPGSSFVVAQEELEECFPGQNKECKMKTKNSHTPTQTFRKIKCMIKKSCDSDIEAVKKIKLNETNLSNYKSQQLIEKRSTFKRLIGQNSNVSCKKLKSNLNSKEVYGKNLNIPTQIKCYKGKKSPAPANVGDAFSITAYQNLDNADHKASYLNLKDNLTSAATSHLKPPLTPAMKHFREVMDDVKTENPTLKNFEISRIIDCMWRNLSPEKLKIYKDDYTQAMSVYRNLLRNEDSSLPELVPNISNTQLSSEEIDSFAGDKKTDNNIDEQIGCNDNSAVNPDIPVFQMSVNDYSEIGLTGEDVTDGVQEKQLNEIKNLVCVNTSKTVNKCNSAALSNHLRFPKLASSKSKTLSQFSSSLKTNNSVLTINSKLTNSLSQNGSPCNITIPGCASEPSKMENLSNVSISSSGLKSLEFSDTHTETVCQSSIAIPSCEVINPKSSTSNNTLTEHQSVITTSSSPVRPRIRVRPFEELFASPSEEMPKIITDISTGRPTSVSFTEIQCATTTNASKVAIAIPNVVYTPISNIQCTIPISNPIVYSGQGEPIYSNTLQKVLPCISVPNSRQVQNQQTPLIRPSAPIPFSNSLALITSPASSYVYSSNSDNFQTHCTAPTTISNSPQSQLMTGVCSFNFAPTSSLRNFRIQSIRPEFPVSSSSNFNFAPVASMLNSANLVNFQSTLNNPYSSHCSNLNQLKRPSPVVAASKTASYPPYIGHNVKSTQNLNKTGSAMSNCSLTPSVAQGNLIYPSLATQSASSVSPVLKEFPISTSTLISLPVQPASTVLVNQNLNNGVIVNLDTQNKSTFQNPISSISNFPLTKSNLPKVPIVPKQSAGLQNLKLLKTNLNSIATSTYLATSFSTHLPLVAPQPLNSRLVIPQLVVNKSLPLPQSIVSTIPYTRSLQENNLNNTTTEAISTSAFTTDCSSSPLGSVICDKVMNNNNNSDSVAIPKVKKNTAVKKSCPPKSSTVLLLNGLNLKNADHTNSATALTSSCNSAYVSSVSKNSLDNEVSNVELSKKSSKTTSLSTTITSSLSPTITSPAFPLKKSSTSVGGASALPSISSAFSLSLPSSNTLEPQFDWPNGIGCNLNEINSYNSGKMYSQERELFTENPIPSIFYDSSNNGNFISAAEDQKDSRLPFVPSDDGAEEEGNNSPPLAIISEVYSLKDRHSENVFVEEQTAFTCSNLSETSQTVSNLGSFNYSVAYTDTGNLKCSSSNIATTLVNLDSQCSTSTCMSTPIVSGQSSISSSLNVPSTNETSSEGTIILVSLNLPYQKGYEKIFANTKNVYALIRVNQSNGGELLAIRIERNGEQVYVPATGTVFFSGSVLNNKLSNNIKIVNFKLNESHLQALLPDQPHGITHMNVTSEPSSVSSANVIAFKSLSTECMQSQNLISSPIFSTFQLPESINAVETQHS